MMKDNVLRIKDKSGNIKEYKIVLVFKNNNKNYIVYSEKEKNDNKIVDVYAATFDMNDLNKLNNIETEEEYIEIQKRLDKLGDYDV